MAPIRTIRIGDKILEIFIDSDSDPRTTMDNLTKIWCSSSCNWILSDIDFRSTFTVSEIEEKISKLNPFYVAPLFFNEDFEELTTISKDGFDHVGFIFIEDEIENAKEVVKLELDQYNLHLSGRVYSYRLSQDLDSCGGFFGEDIEENGMSDCLPKEFVEKLIKTGI